MLVLHCSIQEKISNRHCTKSWIVAAAFNGGNMVYCSINYNCSVNVTTSDYLYGQWKSTGSYAVGLS